MRFYVDEKNRRDACVSRLLLSRGHEETAEGPWDAVILSLPRSDPPADLIERLTPGTGIVCGLMTPEAEASALEKGGRLLRPLQDEAYALKNARLTAEGAIIAAAKHIDFALQDAFCLVVGYGRIGRVLHGMLRGLGARAVVAARREESRREAGGGIPIRAIGDLLPDVQVIFNTVPHPVIGREELRRVRNGALLMELASPPYGIDPKSAREMGINVCLESGVPGRYCPLSAAENLIEYMEREGLLHA